MAPMWGTHFTIIARASLRQSDLSEYEGKKIWFEYDNERIHTDTRYFWMPVRCDYVRDLREKLGLSRDPYWPLHLTFGVMPPE